MCGVWVCCGVYVFMVFDCVWCVREMCVCVHTHVCACVWEVRRQLAGAGSFHHRVCFYFKMQIVGLGGQCLFPLNYPLALKVLLKMGQLKGIEMSHSLLKINKNLGDILFCLLLR